MHHTSNNACLTLHDFVCVPLSWLFLICIFWGDIFAIFFPYLLAYFYKINLKFLTSLIYFHLDNCGINQYAGQNAIAVETLYCYTIRESFLMFLWEDNKSNDFVNILFCTKYEKEHIFKHKRSDSSPLFPFPLSS